jgi:hypothetical protein
VDEDLSRLTEEERQLIRDLELQQKVADETVIAKETYDQRPSFLKGLLGDIGNALTFGYHDEIDATTQDYLAGMGLDWLNPEPLRGLPYEDRLARIQGQRRAYKEEHPVLSPVAEIGSMIVSPTNKVKVLSSAATPFMKLLGATARGAGEGALYATGSADLGEDKWAAAKEGGTYGGLFGAGGEGIRNLIKAAPEMSRAYLLSSYKTPLKEIKESYKELGKAGLMAGEEIPIVDLLKKVESEGVIKASGSLDDNMGRLASAQKPINKELSSIFTKADEVVPASRDIEINSIVKLLDDNGGDKADRMAKYYDHQMELFQKDFAKGGTIKELQKAKVSLNEAYDLENAYKAQVDRAIRTDLKNTIEKRIDDAARRELIDPEYLGQVRKLNKKWGEYQEVLDLMTDVAPRTAKTTIGEKVFDLIKTTGGIGSLIGATAVTGNPLFLAAGLGMVLSRTQRGQRGIASALDALSPLAKEATPPLVSKAKSKDLKAAEEAEKELMDSLTPVERATRTITKQKPVDKVIDTYPSSGRLGSLGGMLSRETPDSSDVAGEDLSLELDRLEGKSGGNRFAEEDLLAELDMLGGEQKEKEGNVKLSKDIDELIQNTAAQEKLSPALLKSIVRQESAFDPAAKSSVGARGLMQLMPATAKDLAERYGIKDYDLHDPATNLKMGAKYYKELLQMFGGDHELALTAYHSGPNRVLKLLDETGGSALSDIIDKLGPVGRRYATNILRRAKDYA